jgi:hypothetical protein
MHGCRQPNGVWSHRQLSTVDFPHDGPCCGSTRCPARPCSYLLLRGIATSRMRGERHYRQWRSAATQRAHAVIACAIRELPVSPRPTANMSKKRKKIDIFERYVDSIDIFHRCHTRAYALVRQHTRFLERAPRVWLTCRSLLFQVTMIPKKPHGTIIRKWRREHKWNETRPGFGLCRARAGLHWHGRKVHSICDNLRHLRIIPPLDQASMRNVVVPFHCSPGRRVAGRAITPVSTQSIHGYSSSPKSGMRRDFSIHGFQTT